MPVKEENASAMDLQSNYYPLKVGAVIIYAVESTAHNNFTNISQNFKFDIKNSIINTFQDLRGYTIYRIERLRRYTTSYPWLIKLYLPEAKA